jgi:uncharacterized protein YtpQ (UPF0354 family)
MVTQGARHWSSEAHTRPVAQVVVALHELSSGSSQTVPALLCTQRSPAAQSRDSLHAEWHRPKAQMRGESQSLLIEQPWSRPARPELELLQLGIAAARDAAATRARTPPPIPFQSSIFDPQLRASQLLPMKSYMSMQPPTRGRSSSRSATARRAGFARAGLGLVLAATLAAGLSACRPRAADASADAGLGAPAASEASSNATPGFDASSEAKFTQSAARLFDDEAPEAAAAVVGTLAIQLSPRGTDEHDLRISLDRVWAACQANAPGCETAARDFVKKSVRTLRMNGKPATRDDIVAVLRSRTYVDAVGGPSTTQAIIEPFAGDLFVVFMVDLPDSMRSLTPNELAGIVPDPRSLPAIAVANLASRLGHLTDALASATPGSFDVLQSHNVFESSRLLMGDEWAALSSKVKAPIVVAAPSGDVLLVAIGPSDAQLATMRDTAQKAFSAAGRPVSPALFRWAKTAWAVVP